MNGIGIHRCKSLRLQDWEKIFAGIAGWGTLLETLMNIKWCKSPYRAVKVPLADSRVCPREHQVVVLHAISPISMKFCLPQRSNRQNGFFFPCFFLFHQGNRLKIPHSMNISLRWYLTDYSKRLHTYCYILDLWMHDASISQFDWQFVKADTWLFFFKL